MSTRKQELVSILFDILTVFLTERLIKILMSSVGEIAHADAFINTE